MEPQPQDAPDIGGAGPSNGVSVAVAEGGHVHGHGHGNMDPPNAQATGGVGPSDAAGVYLAAGGPPQCLPLSTYVCGVCGAVLICVYAKYFFIYLYSRRPIGLILFEPQALHITSCFPMYGAHGP